MFEDISEGLTDYLGMKFRRLVASPMRGACLSSNLKASRRRKRAMTGFFKDFSLIAWQPGPSLKTLLLRWQCGVAISELSP
jgi:hypothetical protein